MEVWITLLISCFTFLLGKTNSEIIVTLPNGQIQGRIEVTYSNVTFYAFQQIPYAEPPVGKLRFMAPQPAKTWDGILDCTVDKKICRQMNNMNDPLENEDCLYVNVYTPVEPGSDSALPVMYYIYGGGFEMGSATYYGAGPHYFMEQGVVVVTVNYRTGPLGFLSTRDTVIPGNNGLKDQNLGLKWVQDNIKYFGGDPEKVTIFGQSAGAASVTYHILSKQSAGLFRAAIAQSGSALTPWAYQRNAKNIAYQFAAKFNSSFDESRSSQEVLELLQSVSEEDIAAAANDFNPVGIADEQLIQGFLFTPVIEAEHEDAFFTENQYSLLESGNFTKVPLIIGICSEEALSKAENLTELYQKVVNFESDVKNLVAEDMHITDDGNLTRTGEKIRKIYTNDQLAVNLSNAVRFYSDAGFSKSIIRYAEMQSKYTDVYFYQFSYFGNMTDMKYIYLPGAGVVSHSGDWKYQWAMGNRSNVHVFPDDDVLTHERYMKLFADFSKYLNPTPEESPLMQNLTWPTVTQENFYYLDIDTDLSIKLNPKEETYTKWVEVYDTWGVQPFDTY